MKLLLDTHVWLWALHAPSRINPRVRAELSNRTNEVWLSPISTWEALLLNARGRIRLPVNLAEWVAQATAPLREAPFTHEIFWPPSNSHCRTRTQRTGFSLLRLRSWT